MNIIFGKWQEEVIYDDHGGHYPCRTDYQAVLMIDGVKCTASFSDPGIVVRIYCNNRELVDLYADYSLKNTDKAEKFIKSAFSKHTDLQSFINEKLFPHISELKESLYQNLLAEAGD